MDNYALITLFIFVGILFLYIHITAQWKKSEDLEIYESDFRSRSQLQEVCDIRQPFMIRMREHNPLFYERIRIDQLHKHDPVDVSVKDVRDYLNPHMNTVDSIPMQFHSAVRLFESDTGAKYVSEHNSEFLDETGLDSIFATFDWAMKPDFTVYTNYDVLFGSRRANTPMRYHTHSRHFLAPTTGRIHVKMAPWKSSKYLHPVKDYDAFEFRSPVPVWAKPGTVFGGSPGTQPPSQYAHDLEKVRMLEFDVVEGYVLYVPPYWWYSVQFSSDSTTTVGSITYSTAMNSLANLSDWSVYYLQQNNITRKFVKPATTSPTERLGMDSAASVESHVEPAPVDTADTPEVIGTGTAEPLDIASNVFVPEIVGEPKQIITNSGVYNV